MCYLPLDAVRTLYSFLIPWNAANEFVNATSPECHPEIHGTACSGDRRGGCSQTQMIQQMRGKLYFDILVYVIDVQKLCLHQKVQKMSPKYPAKTEIRGFCTFETFCAYFMQWNRKKNCWRRVGSCAQSCLPECCSAGVLSHILMIQELLFSFNRKL